jgi:hypothetical protein
MAADLFRCLVWSLKTEQVRKILPPRRKWTGQTSLFLYVTLLLPLRLFLFLWIFLSVSVNFLHGMLLDLVQTWNCVFLWTRQEIHRPPLSKYKLISQKPLHVMPNYTNMAAGSCNLLPLHRYPPVACRDFLWDGVPGLDLASRIYDRFVHESRRRA